MKTNELRLGNWVHDGSRFPMQVVGIFDNDVYLDFEGNEGDVWECGLEGAKPFEIDQEWLNKFGFNKGKFNYKWQFGNFIYDQKLKLWTWFGVQLHDYLIEFVHQLQNLYFALTGQELTIK